MLFPMTHPCVFEVSRSFYIRTIYVSAVCLYQNYVSSAHLLLSISAHCNNTCIIQHYHCYVYHKCCTQDSNMYNTWAPSVSVSHHIEYNRWAGHSTTHTYRLCRAGQTTQTHRSTHTHEPYTDHGRRRSSTKIVQTQTKGRPHCSA